MRRRVEAGDGGGRRGVIVGIRPEHFEDAMLVTLPASGHIFKTKIEVLEAIGAADLVKRAKRARRRNERCFLR
ncbi:MAG TPA: hypothetical protein VJU80_10755 [Solirubrobacteraceae bacterium]|nr:hypothetical protein [Solirubrobacteraceae bacterium]